ncbi:MAG: hypothetical protein ACNA7Y_01260 [Gammaproteobacteria bacterium]
MKITFKMICDFFLADKNQPIQNSKDYKEAIKRVTVWQTLYEEEEKRIIEYLSFKRTHSKE